MKKTFVNSAGVIFLITGLCKIISSSGKSKALSEADPIFGVSFAHLMLFSGLIELIVAIICFIPTKQNLAFLLISWMTANFLAYRAGIYFLGWHHPCVCLGTLTDSLNISPQVADLTLKVILAYLSLAISGLWFFYPKTNMPNGS